MLLRKSNEHLLETLNSRAQQCPPPYADVLTAEVSFPGGFFRMGYESEIASCAF
jgi:hypothetical protein